MRISEFRTAWLVAACAVLLALPVWAVGQNTGDNQYGQYGETTPNQALAEPDLSMIIPAGVRVVVRMTDSINSDINHPGDRFRGTLDEDLPVNGAVLAPKGSNVFGRVVQFNPTMGANTGAGTPSGTNTAGRQPGTAGNPAIPTNPSYARSAPAGSSTQSGNMGMANPSTGNTIQGQILASSSQSAWDQGQLGLILTEIDINGKHYQLEGNIQTTLSTTETENSGETETAGISMVDFNRGAPATAVISSAPSITGNTMSTGIGSGANVANQVVINGNSLNVPSQTVLEFRLQEPLQLHAATGDSSIETP